MPVKNEELGLHQYAFQGMVCLDSRLTFFFKHHRLNRNLEKWAHLSFVILTTYPMCQRFLYQMEKLGNREWSDRLFLFNSNFSARRYCIFPYTYSHLFVQFTVCLSCFVLPS